MLRQEAFDQAVAARLLDFFGAETAWQRRLWDVGTCLSLQEIVEAADAVAARALSAEASSWLRGSLLPLAGPDVGIGSGAQRTTLLDHLKADVTAGSFAQRVIRQIADEARSGYLTRWATAIDTGTPPVGAERLARYVGAHLLGAGLSPEYLHRWWSYRINHEDGTRALGDILRDADARAAGGSAQHEVLVPLRRATARVHEIPGWLPADEASDVLTPVNGRPVAGLAGALRIDIIAMDSSAAVDRAADAVERYRARITLGGGGEGIDPFPFVWVRVFGGDYRRARLRLRRGVELPVLLNRDEPITNPVAPNIDASLELLGPMDQGPATTAAAGGWAAVETLLTAPGDRANVHAADRLASLVACSFPRAELGQLALRFLERDAATNAALAATLQAADTNTARARLLAEHLAAHDLVFSDASDQAACQRMRVLLAEPRPTLRDIEEHLRRPLRRLYRLRNLVLHGGATEALTLTSGVRAAAPLVAAGIDRVARGTILHNVEALDLAARARIVLDNSDHLNPADLADLLQLAVH